MPRRLIIAALVVSVVVCGFASTAFAEGFIDFYVGAASTNNADVDIKIPSFSGTERTDWETSVTAGARFGFWSNAFPFLGLALDGSFFQPSKDLTVYPISLLLMARLPLLKSPDRPQGLLQPYIGAGPALFISDLNGRLADLSAHVSDVSVDVGVDVRGGVTFMLFQNVGLFGEYRFTHVQPGFGVDVSGVDLNAKTKLDTHHFLGGLTFRF